MSIILMCLIIVFNLYFIKNEIEIICQIKNATDYKIVSFQDKSIYSSPPSTPMLFNLTLIRYSIEDESIILFLNIDIEWEDGRLKHSNFSDHSLDDEDLDENKCMMTEDIEIISSTHLLKLWEPCLLLPNTYYHENIKNIFSSDYMEIYFSFGRIIKHSTVQFHLYCNRMNAYPYDKLRCPFEINITSCYSIHALYDNAIVYKGLRIQDVTDEFFQYFLIKDNLEKTCLKFGCKFRENLIVVREQHIRPYILLLVCIFILIISLISFWLPFNAWHVRIITSLSLLSLILSLKGNDYFQFEGLMLIYAFVILSTFLIWLISVIIFIFWYKKKQEIRLLKNIDDDDDDIEYNKIVNKEDNKYLYQKTGKYIWISSLIIMIVSVIIVKVKHSYLNHWFW